LPVSPSSALPLPLVSLLAPSPPSIPAPQQASSPASPPLAEDLAPPPPLSAHGASMQIQLGLRMKWGCCGLSYL
jgi:hypothetical protein